VYHIGFQLRQSFNIIMDKLFFDSYYKKINNNLIDVSSSSLIEAALLIENVEKTSGKVILVGNGGSASIASHVSIDFTKAANIRSINFNEASLLTCFANDYGYENWASNALNFYADSNDIAILISSSGQSKNIINAADKAKKIGLPIITLSGFLESNPLRKMGDVNLWVNSSEYNIVESVHQIWLLSIVEYLISNK
jgi:D-sedoheptulose 7-phosphate isomerase